MVENLNDLWQGEEFMRKEDYMMERLSTLLNTGIFCVEGDVIKSYQENQEYNPLYQSKNLRKKLIKKANEQKMPYIYKDERQIYFAAIRKDTRYYMIGPMSIEMLSRVELHQYYKKYGICDDLEKRLKRFTFSEMLDTVEILVNLLLETEYNDEALIYANHLVTDTKKKEAQEQILFKLKEDEEEIYHHTYQEERKLLDCVREGRVNEALRLTRVMDVDLGKLSTKELNHWKNVVVVGITLCTRAAIEGGVVPSIAYRLSDFYIQKSDSCFDIAQILEYRNHAVEELTSRVLKKKQKRSTSNYVEQCKNYVIKHYREKIYQEDIANTLGISTSYLSRLFRRETGICLQDYINKIRIEHATNLLLYSEETISRIAEYVNFPSQSYFGKIFKEHKHVSPRKFRELYKLPDFF